MINLLEYEENPEELVKVMLQNKIRLTDLDYK
jgi:hypothetical protein